MSKSNYCLCYYKSWQRRDLQDRLLFAGAFTALRVTYDHTFYGKRNFMAIYQNVEFFKNFKMSNLTFGAMITNKSITLCTSN